MRKEDIVSSDGAARMSVAQCIESADIQALSGDWGFSIVARFPLPDGTMLFASVKADGGSDFPVPETRSYLIESASFETILKKEYEVTPVDTYAPYPRFEDVLRRCGLHSSGNDPYSLAIWRDLLSADTIPDLQVMSQAWSEKLQAQGIPALRRHIDTEALDLLSYSSLDLLADDHAYRFVRDKTDDPVAREFLRSHPMVFGEFWCSPELLDDPTPIREALIRKGLSCETAEHNGFHDLKPLPEWLVDWLEGKQFAHSSEYPPSDYVGEGVSIALNLLAILGEASLPETEQDWQSLVRILKHFTSLRLYDNWQKLLPSDAWFKFLAGAENGWSAYEHSFTAALRSGRRKYGVVSHVLHVIWEDAELDPEVHDFPEGEDAHQRLIAAFSRITLLERIAEAKANGEE
jgi:hypothetical protein